MELQEAQGADAWYKEQGLEIRTLVEDPQLKRDRLTLELEEKRSEINLLKSELDPSRVWKNLDLSPERQEELLKRLLEGQYLKDEVEKLLGSEVTQPHTPINRKNQIDKDVARQKAADYWKNQPELSLTEMVRKLQYKHRNDGKPHYTRDYSEETITKWIRDLCPSYSPSKPGRKTKKPAAK